MALCYVTGLIMFLLSLPSDNQNFSIDKTDGLVIFTGGSKRIDTALALVADGYSKPVLISGVNPQVTKEFLLSGLSKENQRLITLDYQSKSTKDNVNATNEWVKKLKLKSVGLITSFYHIPRSMLYWKRSGQYTNVSLYPVFPEKMPLSFMFREYHKYILTTLYVL